MKPESVTCPECGGEMVSRMNRAKQQRFWGCKRYPDCKGTRNTDGEAKSMRGSFANDGGEAETLLPSDRQRGNDRRRW